MAPRYEAKTSGWRPKFCNGKLIILMRCLWINLSFFCLCECFLDVYCGFFWWKKHTHEKVMCANYLFIYARNQRRLWSIKNRNGFWCFMCQRSKKWVQVWRHTCDTHVISSRRMHSHLKLFFDVKIKSHVGLDFIIFFLVFLSFIYIAHCR